MTFFGHRPRLDWVPSFFCSSRKQQFFHFNSKNVHNRCKYIISILYKLYTTCNFLIRNVRWEFTNYAKRELNHKQRQKLMLLKIKSVLTAFASINPMKFMIFDSSGNEAINFLKIIRPIVVFIIICCLCVWRARVCCNVYAARIAQY